MRLLLDTHFVFWLGVAPERLTDAEQALVGRDDSWLFASVVSLWELRVKWERRFVSGARKGPAHPAEVLSSLRRNRIEILDLTATATVTDLQPAIEHGDPFDLLLLTQAQQGGYRLLTRDEKLASHPIALVA